ncbi:hypothetical protein [Clostridium sp.]|uniref:hypothetical protein n=1 Tax=Clostridium sp. TaxID=1506 RepID=UPI002FC95202
MLNNMDIAGNGTVGSGEYDRITISGMGKVVGDIKSKSLDVSGLGKSIGVINSENMNISGKFTTYAFIESTKQIEISGCITCKDGIKGKDIRINGYAKVLSKIQFDNLEINGVIKGLNGAEGRKFVSEGVVNIDGLLSADYININMFKTSKIKEIGGEEIVVRRRTHGGVSEIFFKGNLVSDLIEGDKIYLERTKAKVVRGGDITIGIGSVIDRVEYSKNLSINDGAIVKEKILIG